MFAPIVILTRNLIGKPEFIQLRGKLIALHSKAITRFCNSVGIERTQRQNLIRLARDNGKRLGLLA
ncbi:MAG: electron transporter [Leptolyngbyaceae cyanobacterium MO_188.B28]|nr:electron transporter [Leptolyngbyaceae cyanobacterium MO_188.B28]